MVESRVCDDKDHQDDDSKARGTLKDVSESNEHQQELQEKDSRPHRFAGKIRAWWLRKTRRKLERPRVSAPISIPADNPFAGPLPEGHTIPVRRKQHEDIDPPAEAQSGYFSREEVLQGSAYRDVVSWMLPERIPDPEPTWEESADDSGRQFMLDPLEYERVRRDYGRSVLIRQFVEKAVNHGVTLEQAEDFKREMGISPAEYEAICRNYARTVRLRCFVEIAAWHGVAPEYAELFARENNVTVSERKQMQADIARLIEERERQEAQFEPNPSYLPSISIAPLGEPLRGRSNNIFHAKPTQQWDLRRLAHLTRLHFLLQALAILDRKREDTTIIFLFVAVPEKQSRPKTLCQNGHPIALLFHSFMAFVLCGLLSLSLCIWILTLSLS